MGYKYVDDVLREKGLKLASLNVLAADEHLIRYAIIQPKGEIVANENGLTASPGSRSYEKVKKFLQLTRAQSTDLVVTPEYFVPWELIGDISGGLKPNEQELWVLCFESIHVPKLRDIIARYDQSITFIVDIPAGNEEDFLNPLVYVFNAKNDEETIVTVAIIQFKTKPMADRVMQLERASVLFGNNFYIFRKNNSIHLMSVICSDALEFDPNRIDVTEDGDISPWEELPFLFIHPQLNTGPSHELFREYRNKWLKTDVKKKQILTVNWARGSSLNGEQPRDHREFGKSAIYFKEQLAESFDRHQRNHEKGLYYTYSENRNHGFYFNYNEHCFVAQLPKVSMGRTNPVSANTAVPILEKCYQWNESWEEIGEADSGYVQECRWRRAPQCPFLSDTPEPHMLEKEVIINRAVGGLIKVAKDFHKIDSVIVSPKEALRRITFTHDVEEGATDYRRQTIGLFDDLCMSLLPINPETPANLKSMQDPKLGLFENGFNLKSQNGSMAAVAFVGYKNDVEAKKIFSEICKLVSNENSRKVCVWYKDDGRFKTCVNSDISYASASESSTDFTKEGGVNAEFI